MTHRPLDPNYEDRVRDSFNRQVFMATLGARLVVIEPGHVSIEIPFRADLTQQHGFIHAGVVGSILDSACGYAAFSLMPPETGVLSVEYKLNLLAPAAGTRFVASGRVVKAGRTLTVCAGEVIAQADGKAVPVAVMQATMMTIVDRPGIKD